MQLRHIEPGTKMSFFEEHDHHAAGSEHEAVFRYFESDTHFVIKCASLYDRYETLGQEKNLRISFTIGPHIYTFHGRAVEKKQISGMLMIEQRTDLIKINRRVYERDELRLHVRINGLPADMIGEPKHHKIGSEPDMTDMTFDVSSGGLCVISSRTLRSEHDPYYLLEFSLSDKDKFTLPAKLVRRSNNPRARIGRYEYGFQFIFDIYPDAKGRLTSAILSKKLSHV